MRFAILALTALTASACSPASEKRADVDPNCFSRASDKVGGPLSLISQDGARVTEGNFQGRKSLVFFGFTHCPDVCPETLFKVGTAMTLLPEGVKPPHTILISVDPARDTPEALTRYIASNGFPTDITGLTGSDAELEAVATAFAAPFSRNEDPDSATGYSMNHTSILYLMDADWKLETFFTQSDRPEVIAKCIAALS